MSALLINTVNSYQPFTKKIKYLATAISSVMLSNFGHAAVIGSDDFDGADTFLTRIFSGTINTVASTFDIGNRSSLLNADIVDNSAFASGGLALDVDDSIGFLESTDTDSFLGINRAGTRALTYTFDISGYTDLSLSAEFIFGENWVSIVNIDASIDGGTSSNVFLIDRNTADSTLTMEDTDTFNIGNTAQVTGNGLSSTLITDSWTDYSSTIAGSGSVLTLVISQPGSFAGSLGIDNLVLNGTAVIPEPSTYALLAGLSGLAFVMVRRRRA